MTSVSLYFALFFDFVSFYRKNLANQRAFVSLRWGPLEGVSFCFPCPIGPHSTTPEWQQLGQWPPEGASSGFWTCLNNKIVKHQCQKKETKVKKLQFSGETMEPAKNITQVLFFIKEFKNMGKHSKYSAYKLSFFSTLNACERAFNGLIAGLIQQMDLKWSCLQLILLTWLDIWKCYWKVPASELQIRC